MQIRWLNLNALQLRDDEGVQQKLAMNRTFRGRPSLRLVLFPKAVLHSSHLTYIMDASRHITITGAIFGYILTDFHWLIGRTVVLFAAGIVLFRRGMVS